MISIHLNGEVREVPASGDLTTLLQRFSLPEKRVAIEINGEVVRRGDWSRTIVADGDRIEVVHFVGGG